MTGDLLAYTRLFEDEELLVALNLGAGPFDLSLATLGGTGRIILSTHLDREEEAVVESIGLRANEGVIVALSRATRVNPP
jgi:alpha-glucosidase